jgi:hypothetical protein
VALQKGANGTSRHFAATPDVGRFRTEADMNRQARPAASVASDPFSTLRSAELLLRKTITEPRFAVRKSLL